MPKILVVEDEVDLCNLVKSHLEAEGHSVAQAFDGPSALTLVESQRPDLIILDWMLPGMDGAFGLPAGARPPLDAHPDAHRPSLEEIDRVLGLEVGADDYVVKPFSIRERWCACGRCLRRVALDSRVAGPAGETGLAPTADGRDAVPPRRHSRSCAGSCASILPGRTASIGGDGGGPDAARVRSAAAAGLASGPRLQPRVPRSSTCGATTTTAWIAQWIPISCDCARSWARSGIRS